MNVDIIIICGMSVFVDLKGHIKPRNFDFNKCLSPYIDCGVVHNIWVRHNLHATTKIVFNISSVNCNFFFRWQSTNFHYHENLIFSPNHKNWYPHIVVFNTYCVVFLFCFSLSSVPYVASFSGLSIFDCPFGITVLCLVSPMLPVFLDCQFLIAPSVFSNVYLTEFTVSVFKWRSHKIWLILITENMGSQKQIKIQIVYVNYCNVPSEDQTPYLLHWRQLLWQLN